MRDDYVALGVDEEFADERRRTFPAHMVRKLVDTIVKSGSLPAHCSLRLVQLVHIEKLKAAERG